MGSIPKELRYLKAFTCIYLLVPSIYPAARNATLPYRFSLDTFRLDVLKRSSGKQSSNFQVCF